MIPLHCKSTKMFMQKQYGQHPPRIGTWFRFKQHERGLNETSSSKHITCTHAHSNVSINSVKSSSPFGYQIKGPRCSLQPAALFPPLTPASTTQHHHSRRLSRTATKIEATKKWHRRQPYVTSPPPHLRNNSSSRSNDGTKPLRPLQPTPFSVQFISKHLKTPSSLDHSNSSMICAPSREKKKSSPISS